MGFYYWGFFVLRFSPNCVQRLAFIWVQFAVKIMSFFPSWRVAFFRRSDSAAQFFLLPPHSLNACNRLVDRSSRWYLTWSPEPVIFPTDQYCWFARDVTAAMLAVKNKSISLLWELNSIFILFLGEKITLFWLPTWHVAANREYKWRL